MNGLPDDVGNSFCLDGSLRTSSPHGNGNVNDTFLLACEKEGQLKRYTLQRINHEVFKDPESLMENFSRVTKHLQGKLSGEDHTRKALALVPTKDGRSFFRDSDGNYWRTTKYIDESESLEVPDNPAQAYEAAKAFGEFQAHLSDLPGDPLKDTIPDFHNTRKRFEHFLEAVRTNACNRAEGVGDLVEFARQRESLADAIRVEDFPTRVVHNDTKLNNVLLDKKSGKGLCVVDLDTVMPGCVLHDFGDLVRTAACSSAEDEKNLALVRFLPDIFEAIAEGYLNAAREFLEPSEIAGLPLAPKVITFELGIRFLTDYLEGDTYFKVKREGHNLDRTRAQFQLLASMEEHEEDIRAIIQRYAS